MPSFPPSPVDGLPAKEAEGGDAVGELPLGQSSSFSLHGRLLLLVQPAHDGDDGAGVAQGWTEMRQVRQVDQAGQRRLPHLAAWVTGEVAEATQARAVVLATNLNKVAS